MKITPKKTIRIRQPLTMKNAYRLIKQTERIHARRRSSNIPKLINMLINIKSYGAYGRVYEGEERKQLLFILKKQKTWNGDVRIYFKNIFAHSAFRPSSYKDHLGMSKRREKYTDHATELPF